MAEMDEIRKDAETYAAIDIGSNAVRLLIKQLESDTRPLFNKALLLRVPLRLGFDVFAEGKISRKKEKDLIRLMKCYRQLMKIQLMKIYNVDDYRACATSAMRDAENGQSVIRTVFKETGIRIEIIDGQEEAKMIYSNHIETMRGRKGNFMFVDVGGGSTEINLLADGGLVCSRSYNIGTVRSLNGAVDESEWQRLRSDMADLAGDNRRNRMNVEALQEIFDRLNALTVEQRIEEYGLKPDRADVIIPAGRIFLTIAGITGATWIYVPVIGLADGIIDWLYTRNHPDPVR